MGYAAVDFLLGVRHQQITIRVLRLNQRGQIKFYELSKVIPEE